jgi:hyaluronan synthase
LKKAGKYISDKSIAPWMLFLLLIFFIVSMKLLTFDQVKNNLFFAAYSFTVCIYIISRFVLAYCYSPERDIVFDGAYLPTITFGVPAKDEGDNIRETILRIAASDYPRDRFEVIAVNDGSSDNTLQEMHAAQAIAGEMGVAVRIVNWKRNRGKRHGMAECIKRSGNEIMVFIDSDSFVEPETARMLSKYFIDTKIAAAAGHTFVTNENENILTKMQAVKYFVAFKSNKAAEALFGTVTCCSGCCSAYRREYVLEVLDLWLNQSFLGVKCTYGDDRSLTNFLLQRGYKTIFAPDAIAYTLVPTKYMTFMRQQLRWKKSWVKESFKAASFIWRKNPIMSLSFYISLILPFLTPVVVIRALIWYPYKTGHFPVNYFVGLLLIAALYGIYYFIFIKDRNWIYSMLFATFYSLILIWQLPYAILNLRDVRWGTR